MAISSSTSTSRSSGGGGGGGGGGGSNRGLRNSCDELGSDAADVAKIDLDSIAGLMTVPFSTGPIANGMLCSSPLLIHAASREEAMMSAAVFITSKNPPCSQKSIPFSALAACA